MIQLNDRACEWEEGLTVEKLIQRKRYVYPRKIIRINNQIIAEEEYATTFIRRGDDVKIIHLMAGG